MYNEAVFDESVLEAYSKYPYYTEREYLEDKAAWEQRKAAWEQREAALEQRGAALEQENAKLLKIIADLKQNKNM